MIDSRRLDYFEEDEINIMFLFCFVCVGAHVTFEIAISGLVFWRNDSCSLTTRRRPWKRW